MKLRRMDFRLLTSLLLLVLFIVPVKSESSASSKERREEFDHQKESGENHEEDNEDKSDNEYVTNVLNVALPVGTFVLLILLAVISFDIRRKVKGLMGQFRGNCDKSPEFSNAVYGINGPAFANTTSDKSDNLKYAMQTGQEHIQPVNIQTGVYDYPKPVHREKFGEQTNKIPSNTVAVSPRFNYRPGYEEVDVKEPHEPYDTTYQTLCGQRDNTSYDHIMGPKASIMTTPQAKLGGTAYENAAI